MRLLVPVLFSVVRMSDHPCSCLRLTSCVMSTEPIKFQWSGGTPPYYISLLPGTCQTEVCVAYAHACNIFQLSRSLPHRYERPLELSILRLLTWRRFATQLKIFPVQQGTSFTWTVDLQANTAL